MSHIFLGTVLGAFLPILSYAALVMLPVYIGHSITDCRDRFGNWMLGIWVMAVVGIGILISFAIGNFILSLFV